MEIISIHYPTIGTCYEAGLYKAYEMLSIKQKGEQVAIECFLQSMNNDCWKPPDQESDEITLHMHGEALHDNSLFGLKCTNYITVKYEVSILD